MTLATLVLAFLPYCTPAPAARVSACLDWMIQCTNGDLNFEEACSESIPLELEGE
jgi:hypothetical protein